MASPSMDKIFICCNSYPPENGGAPIRISNMARALSAAGYEVHIITGMPNYPTGRIFPNYKWKLSVKEKDEKFNIHIHRLWLYPSNSRNAILRILSIFSFLLSFLLLATPRIIFDKRAGIIVSTPPLALALMVSLIARIFKRKIIVNVSDIWPLTALEMGALKDNFVYKWLKKSEIRLYNNATGFTGQSETILQHISKVTQKEKPSFLYRNLQQETNNSSKPLTKKKMLYAGNLGHAQGVLKICTEINWAAIGMQLDIYGEGAERMAIEQYALEHNKSIRLHHALPQEELSKKTGDYTAILIPLKTEITGAVPSKLYMAIAHGIPVIFAGGGEGATIVKRYNIGLVCPPGDYFALQECIQNMARTEDLDWQQWQQNMFALRTENFSKTYQDKAFVAFVRTVFEFR